MKTCSLTSILFLLILLTGSLSAQNATQRSRSGPSHPDQPGKNPLFRTADLIARSASFDGTDDFITMGIDPVHQVTSALTVEAWIKPTVNLGYAGIVNNLWETSGNRGGFGLTMGGVSANVMFAVTNSVSATYFPVNLPALNQWSHVAATYDGSMMRVYVNGTLEGSMAKTGNISYATANALRIGAYVDDNESYYYTGAVDDVRLWNVVRTQSEIADNRFVELTGTESGLVGYWKLNEGSGISANDETANNKDGVLTNGVGWLSETGLPVELVSFNAQTIDSDIELSWTTATEVNNHGFEIERMNVSGFKIQDSNINPPNLKPEPSNSGWTRIGFVEGNGTTNTAHEYSYTDRNVIAGTYAYRMKQIDRDGRFAYSNEIEISINSGPTFFALRQNYPNPFNPVTMISFQLPMSGHASLRVVDAVGREVAELINEVKEAGSYSVPFNGSQLASGLYVAILRSGGRTEIRKMMLVK